MTDELVITVTPDGIAKCIYDDNFVDFIQALGNVNIVRASHVEPNAGGEWEADMSPVGGPVLPPCKLRAEALQAERDWLMRNIFNEENQNEQLTTTSDSSATEDKLVRF